MKQIAALIKGLYGLGQTRTKFYEYMKSPWAVLVRSMDQLAAMNYILSIYCSTEEALIKSLFALKTAWN